MNDTIVLLNKALSASLSAINHAIMYLPEKEVEEVLSIIDEARVADLIAATRTPDGAANMVNRICYENGWSDAEKMFRKMMARESAFFSDRVWRRVLREREKDDHS